MDDQLQNSLAPTSELDNQLDGDAPPSANVENSVTTDLNQKAVPDTDSKILYDVLRRLDELEKRIKKPKFSSSKSSGSKSSGSNSRSTVTKDSPSAEEYRDPIAVEVEGALNIKGVLYTPAEKWHKERYYILDCDLFVAVTSFEQDSLRLQDPESFNTQHGKTDASPWITNDEQDRQKLGLHENVDTDGRPKTLVPERLRIINLILLSEMSKIVGFGVNHDHVPPFRTFVTFEERFRQRLVDQEETFKELCQKYPADLPQIIDDARKERRKHLADRDRIIIIEENRSGPRPRPPASEIVVQKILLDGLRSLVYFLDTNLKESLRVRRMAESKNPGDIAFGNLWYLFQTGQEIISTKPMSQVYRVLQATGGRRHLQDRSGNRVLSLATGKMNPLVIDCFYIDFDGKNFRPVPRTITIQPYEGYRSVDSLEAYPLSLGKFPKDFKEDLIDRGKRFVQLVQVTHKRYKGLSLKEGDTNNRYEELDSDVIIDFELAFRKSKIETPYFEGGVITNPTEEDMKEFREETQSRARRDGPSIVVAYDDPVLYKSRRATFINNTSLLEPRPIGNLGRDRWILLPYRVYGYVLLSRKWYPLNIDLVRDIEPIKEGDKDGFNDLVLPAGHKDIVRALVNTHARGPITSGPGDEQTSTMAREIDLVSGKGKGLIILLHGAPGVGKTSTAECVAANTGRPLFPITCGDIGGDSAQQVEEKLEEFFDLARKWGCVLLLDEADVFLSERTKGNIKQNSLVSVFLRVLEYYSGILILTTNRVGEFDEAIKSRVHCALYYPPLDKTNTLAVWKMNLDRLNRLNKDVSCKRPIQFDRKEIVSFAKEHWKTAEASQRWNGRQIKNSFQTAIALAEWDSLKENMFASTKGNPVLKSSHFATVAVASAHFDYYLTKVRQSDQVRAKSKEIRHDGLDAQQTLDAASVKLKSVQNMKGPVAQKQKRPAWPGEVDEEESETETSTESEQTDCDVQDKKKKVPERQKSEAEGKDREHQKKGAKKGRHAKSESESDA